MKWVTWMNVGIDRIGCAWAIKRFIDPEAEFIFVPEETTKLPADAEPFDIPHTRLSHHGGHCSFYALVREYKLEDPVLKKIALIIDEADTEQEVSLEPAAQGIDVICRGIRLISDSDQAAIDRGALIYDGLYAELLQEEPE